MLDDSAPDSGLDEASLSVARPIDSPSASPRSRNERTPIPRGWNALLSGAPWFRGAGAFPIEAYSEFMPPPRLGRKPYAHAGVDEELFDAADPFGWQVTEYEEEFTLRPGLESVAGQIVGALGHLARGSPAHGISKGKLADNPYWPPELARHAGRLAHERCLTLLPLALARTLDDKGRVRWTLFGNSELDPERAFWKGFFAGPARELPAESGLAFFARLLRDVHGQRAGDGAALRRAGFRILEGTAASRRRAAGAELPAWTQPFLWTRGQSLRGVHHLLTFVPFAELPVGVRKAYVHGDLHLWPFPGSLLFFGVTDYADLARDLPLASQIPLLHLVARHEGPRGLRVPQSGWLHEPRAGESAPDTRGRRITHTYNRTHRWARVLRDEDELELMRCEAELLHVLFSTIPDDLGLYGKPMARNVQLWTDDHRNLLDGPNASPRQLRRAMAVTEAGGMFGYRFLFPAMRVGRREVYWHRPLVAWLTRRNQTLVAKDAPLGFLTAYARSRSGAPDLARPIELWPRLLQREPHLAAIRAFASARVGARTGAEHQPTIDAHKLLEAWRLLGREPLDPTLARRLVSGRKGTSFEAWLAALPAKSSEPKQAARLSRLLRRIVSPPSAAAKRPRSAQAPAALTFARTSTRAFEVAYWKTIAHLSEGRWITKNNADVVRDARTHRARKRTSRDLGRLGDHLLAQHRRAVEAAGMKGRARVLDLPFRWRTDWDFSWSAGWLANQHGRAHERNLVVVIPGRDRRRAVVMADHYDTAYMEDRYAEPKDQDGPRLAASGADDNHSATAALLLAAPILLDLAREGRLECDVWLVHLTGEEFPADCLGARALCERLVDGTLGPRASTRLSAGTARGGAGSALQVEGVYVLDMIAHNNPRARDVFQISPGEGAASMRLARHAHAANELWNASTAVWNRQAARQRRARSPRSTRGSVVPAVARHPVLGGEIRPPSDPRSTLFNTDGQIFSDAGIPVVLFMENYDITRKGYHDSLDTLANIDLDYGAALAAIAIESVARAAAHGV